MTKKLYSVSEIAEVVGVSEYTVREWLKGGKLNGIKPGRDWRVTEEDLTKFLKERHG